MGGSAGNGCMLRADPFVASSDLKSIGGSCCGTAGTDTGAELVVTVSVAGLPACASNPQLPKKPTVLPATINQRSLC
jgi:hypothetical protein